MMEFDEIVVKESPGLCRCCLSEGCYKDLGTEYNWMNEAEVYADMLLECFDISITQHNNGPNGPNRLICEVCITRLRDACNFKKQVMDSEKKFIDMMGRGEFRPKMFIYQAQLKCEDPSVEEPIEDADVEYLEDEIDFGEDVPKDELTQPSVSDITVSTLPVKVKRGRPRKNTPVKPEKRSKVAKVDDKAKTSKAVAKGSMETGSDTEINQEDIPESKSLENTATNDSEVKKTTLYGLLETQNIMRENVTQVLERSTLMPFRWLKKSYRCFYCYEIFHQPKNLKEHQEIHNNDEIAKRMDYFLDPAVNVDVSSISCKLCPEKIDDLYSLVDHLVLKHGIEFNKDIDIGMNPFKLNSVNVSCAVCNGVYQSFDRLLFHMNVYHNGASNVLCDICGSHFKTKNRLKEHISSKHENKTVKCRFCDDEMTPTTLRTHLQKFHGKNYKCLNCTEVFETHYKRSLHMMTVHKNGEKVKCPRCPLSFVFHSTMVRHLKATHLKERNVICSICGWKSFEGSRLQRHMSKHSNERNYTCIVCSKAFKTDKTLKAHCKNKHLKAK